jgi:hypothetical protein
MSTVPSPVYFSGLVAGAIAAGDVKGFGVGPSPLPEISMKEALEPNKGKPDRVGGPTQQMVNALAPSMNPAKMELWDLSRFMSTADPDPKLPLALQAHFNPKELHETIKVVWNDITVHGLERDLPALLVHVRPKGVRA